MGISTSFGRLLVRAKERGAIFTEVATIGRQSLMIPIEEIESMATRLGRDVSDVSRTMTGDYADYFFHVLLGAQEVISFDLSDYQGASVFHDFNQPIAPVYQDRFDALVDGGTMEHIFDVRCVLENYMRMVKVGGSIFINTPANNLFGHGFYQFSPELFYRVFSDENGFAMRDVCLTESPLSTVELSRQQRCFKTVDPLAAGKRIRLVNDKPLMLFVQAQRVEDKPLFRSSPLQSDYIVKWEHFARKAESGEVPEVKPSAKPFRYVSRLEELRRRYKQKYRRSLRNRRFFQPFEP